MDSFEEKFAYFFNQFESDKEIELLFQFLDVILNQYKSNPVKVCDFLKKSRLKRSDPKSNESPSAILANQTEEIIISDDESVPTNSCKKIKIEKVEPTEKTFSSSYINNMNVDIKGNIRMVESLNELKKCLETKSSVQMVVKEEPKINCKEKWLDLYYSTVDSEENCHFVWTNIDVFKFFKQSVESNDVFITRPIMSLLSNIAEVNSLRKKFFHSYIIKLFHQLINSTASLSFRSIKLLILLISEGPVAWQINDCKLSDRTSIIQEIEGKIYEWKSKKVKVIFSSIQCVRILEILEQSDQPICSKWACWILAQSHISLSESQKEYLKKKLKQIISDPTTDKLCKFFAKQALNKT